MKSIVYKSLSVMGIITLLALGLLGLGNVSLIKIPNYFSTMFMVLCIAVAINWYYGLQANALTLRTTAVVLVVHMIVGVLTDIWLGESLGASIITVGLIGKQMMMSAISMLVWYGVLTPFRKREVEPCPAQ
ncbi:hypothetical protein [Erwinia sp. S59]|uniref:hypothetical protein n=1 Tax=Erwinia sp. S59 TaxID=2769340 RepID=UPI00190E2BAB|nr:hypothetical protein [Erwinia sp. S59]MBK0092817.1 hypothetical protein [Erwinia sp. S59]